MEKVEKKMSAYYCAKQYPIEEMKQLPDEYPNWYYPECYPEVLEAHCKLPWNWKRY
ncbi:hypothetical protein [Bacillus sp. MUM 116]|uniref:hypothetical protein n=1 Tax=Bacillus sp. MUM 116 TaxID=1678002 RepID=UPI0015A686E8|nr:hypothetical protein [Bacillus sp. MUM 116]